MAELPAETGRTLEQWAELVRIDSPMWYGRVGLQSVQQAGEGVVGRGVRCAADPSRRGIMCPRRGASEPSPCAILRDPAVLVLDEATSSLDSEGEALVRQALDRLMWAGRR